MSRTINASTITALASDSLRIATLVQFDFDTVIRITDWNRDVSAMSQTWDSSAHLLGISESVETSELRISSLSIQLSGVEQTYISLFLNNDYHDIRARVWKAVLDSSEAVIGAPILIFDGRISDFGIDDNDDSSIVEIVASSHWANFDAINGRRTNHNSQQLYFSGDLGFEFASDTIQDIKWGRA